MTGKADPAVLLGALPSSAQEGQERVLNPLELEYKLMSATLWVLENQLSQLLYKNSKCSEQLRHLSSPKYPMLEDASYCL